MKNACVLLALTLCTPWGGCSGTPTQPVPRGAFAYTSYDTAGTALVTGWFTMNVSDAGTISGEWHFRTIGNPEHAGPQTGDGVLLGGFSEGKIWLELNPQYRDNNLQLCGTLDGDRYVGEWIWVSFAGVTNHGTFAALRR